MIVRTSRFSPFIICAAALAWACSTRSQTPAVKIENTNASYIPTDVPTPQANPARPTVTIPAHLPPTGYLQFEQGFVQVNGSPAGLSAQTLLVQTTRLALTTHLLVQLITEPFAHSRFDTPSTTTHDSGDLLLGGQAVLYRSIGVRPTIDLGYLRRVHTGTSPSLDAGESSQSVLLFLGGDLPASFHYDSNLVVDEQDIGPVRRPQFTQTLALSRPLRDAPRAYRYLERSHFTQPLVSAPETTRANAVDLLFGGAFSLRPNLILDAAFARGLTSTSTQWQGTFGVSYLLPHRLWPDTHPLAIAVGHPK